MVAYVDDQNFSPLPAEHEGNSELLVVHRHPGAPAKTLVLLVHGLGGRRYKTWGLTPHFLFQDIPNSDIGLCDYASGLRRWNRPASVDLARHAEHLADTIRDLPYEKFVLIGHSMGGLLCQAAVKDLLDSRVHDAGGSLVVKRVAAIFLMATPQAGTVRIPSLISRYTRDGRVLRVHSRFVTEVQRRFNDQVITDPKGLSDPKRIVLPVYAAVATGDKWVDDLSARLGLPRQRIKTARGSHTSIIKPTGREDDVYAWLVNRIRAHLDMRPTTAGKSQHDSLPTRHDEQSPPTVWRSHAIVDGDQLFGVDGKVAKVTEAVGDRSGGWAVSLVGGGGIGKTALAYEVVQRCVQNGLFTRIAWASATNATPSSRNDSSSPATAYWFDVVRTISEQLQLGIDYDGDLQPHELAERVATLPAGERLLTVLDNLESVEDATSAVHRLEEMGLVRPHKVIVTTRWPLLTETSALVTSFEATNLDFQSTSELIHHLGRGDDDLAVAKPSVIEPVFSVTRGNPFLIKLVIREYLTTHRSLSRVIGDLKQLGGADGYQTLGDRVYASLYLRSVDALRRLCGPRNADFLMAAFITHDSGQSFTEEELAQLSGLEGESEFRRTLQTACQLSLVRAFDLNQRYAIHSLLYDFLLLILTHDGETSR